MRLAEQMDVEATLLGEFTTTGRFHVFFEGKTVAYLDMEFLHEKNPSMRLSARWRRPINRERDLRLPGRT